MPQKFKKGDIVTLKSGGPDMTVSGYESSINLSGPSRESEEIVVTTWFDNRGEKKVSNFHQDTLELAED